jgi:hypothetical protein
MVFIVAPAVIDRGIIGTIGRLRNVVELVAALRDMQ